MIWATFELEPGGSADALVLNEGTETGPFARCQLVDLALPDGLLVVLGPRAYAGDDGIGAGVRGAVAASGARGVG